MKDIEIAVTETSEHHPSYLEHFGTWAGLVMLTIMTVMFSSLWTVLGDLAIVVALIFASSKAMLVALYFMHVKYDPRIYKTMIVVVVALFVFFIVMLTIDYLTR